MRVTTAAVLACVSVLAACDSPTRPPDLGGSPGIRKQFCFFDPCVISTYEAVSYVAGVRVTDLGTLKGDIASQANDVNDAGQIVGMSNDNVGNFHAAYWPAPGMIQQLPPLVPGGASGANGINASGMIVGFSQNAAGGVDGALWVNGAATDLTISDAYYAGSVLNSTASRINDAGTIVGSFEPPNVGSAIALWSAGSTVDTGGFVKNTAFGTDINNSLAVGGIGPKGGAPIYSGDTALMFPIGLSGTDIEGCPTTVVSCWATGISDGGRVVGQLAYGTPPAGSYQHAFTSDSLVNDQDLGTMWPSNANANSYATDVDETSLVVGHGNVSSPNGGENGQTEEAFLWGSDFGFYGLPWLPGSTAGAFSYAYGTNPHLLGDSILIVGSSNTSTKGPTHATLWSVTLGLEPVITVWPGVWGRPFTPIIYENPAYLSNPNYDRYIEVKFAGAGNFDPNTIDVSSLQMNGTKPVYTEIKDLNGDGYQDLLMLFSMKQLMQSGGLTSRTIQLTVKGNLLKIGAPILATSGVTICLSARSCPTDDTVTGPT